MGTYANDTSVGIVFTDVDGTLVDNNHHPILETASVMRRAAERVPICLVSARSPEGLYPIQRQLEFTGPLACFSGAYVLDHEGNELYSSVIAIEEALELKSFFERELPDVVVATYGHHDWIVDDRSDPRIVREEFFVQAESRESSDLARTFGERGVHKFLLMGEPPSILRAQQVVAEQYPHLNAVRSNDILCEVMTGEASKSHAIDVLLAHYGVHAASAVAFGDGPNDIDMLSAVSRSFAMANAEESVKRAASTTIDWTNEECGVARMLAQLLDL